MGGIKESVEREIFARISLKVENSCVDQPSAVDSFPSVVYRDLRVGNSQLIHLSHLFIWKFILDFHLFHLATD